MADDPPSIPEQSTNHNTDPANSDPDCPFCTIAQTFQPIAPHDSDSPSFDPDRLSPPTYVLLSTAHVIAFLDIAPLTRGHVLVAPRHHRTKIGDLSPFEASQIGRVLPLIARSVLGASYPDIDHADADYNVVQNNGPGAAQVIPHVHFHVIPRPPLDYRPPDEGGKGGYGRATVPTGLKASYVQFGRGQRHELDDEDAIVLVKQMREKLKVEWEKEFGSGAMTSKRKSKKKPRKESKL